MTRSLLVTVILREIEFGPDGEERVVGPVAMKECLITPTNDVITAPREVAHVAHQKAREAYVDLTYARAHT